MKKSQLSKGHRTFISSHSNKVWWELPLYMDKKAEIPSGDRPGHEGSGGHRNPQFHITKIIEQFQKDPAF